jgi:hypothetical protein
MIATEIALPANKIINPLTEKKAAQAAIKKADAATININIDSHYNSILKFVASNKMG